MKILNIYGQEAWHTDAKIVGNLDGLWELHRALEQAIKMGNSKTSEINPLFASDGEGYQVVIECHNDKWGIKAPIGSYWNKEESNPQYLIQVTPKQEGMR